MICDEFANEFDVIYNSITSNKAPGLDDYEKSVFLTKAEYEILHKYANPKANKLGDGLDGSRRRQADFSNLTSTKTIEKVEDTAEYTKLDNRSICYRTPVDLFIPINESCSDKTSRYVVTPITFDDYDTLMTKPYQYPIRRHVWRIFTNSKISSVGKLESTIEGKSYKCIIYNSTDKTVELKVNIVPGTTAHTPIVKENLDSVTIECNIGTMLNLVSYKETYFNSRALLYQEELYKYIGDIEWPNNIKSEDTTAMTTLFTVTAPPATNIIELIGRTDADSLSYKMRYIRKPKPIILVDLEDGLSIDGYTKKTECEIDSELHREILQRAVELAKASYMGDLNSMLTLGQVSQTEIGSAPQQSR